MVGWRMLGDLERSVMEHLWSASESQTVREVHTALSAHRTLAYSTVMTVLGRLAGKGLVVRDRSDRVHRYTAAQGRDELVARLMVDVLCEVSESGASSGALVRFVERVGASEVVTLRRALRERDGDPPVITRGRPPGG